MNNSVSNSWRRSFPTFARWFRRLGGPPRLQWEPWRSWRMNSWLPRDDEAGQQWAFLRLLAVAADQKLPWAPLVASWADDHSGRRRRRLFRLARRLEEATPLADALEQTPGALSADATLAVRFGMQSGMLAETLRSTAARERGVQNLIATRWRRMFYYLGVLILIGAAFGAFITHKIFPSFIQIYADFQIRLPTLFNLWLAAVNFAETYVLLVPVLLVLFAALYYSPRVEQTVRRIWLPRVSRSAASLGVAQLLELLAVAIRTGRPLQGAVSTLARYHDDPRIRRKLLYIRNEVEQGANLWATAARSGLLSRAEVEAIEKSATAAGRAWAMERLAATRRVRVAERLETMLDMLHPAAVLLVAAFVLTMALATLLPLIELIHSLGG